MAVTRIKNNQITDSTVVANAKLVDHSVSSNKLANDLVYGSNFTVTGNLTVQGTSTTIDTTITTIEDPVIVLASTQTSGSPTVDIGFLGYRGNQSNIAYVWDESASEFVTAFTSTGETNSTITITSYANFHTNDANVGGNLTVGGNISITGNVTSLNVTGNISGGNLLTTGVVTATGNVSGGNVTTAGQVAATGNVSGGNLTTIGQVTATGNVSGGNVTTAGEVTATGNVSGGNLTTAGQVAATGNISGNNISATNEISAGTTITATGNISGGNVNTAGQVAATGNVSGNNISATNEISAGTTITATGNVSGGNITTAGVVSATGNVSGGNITTIGVVQATGNVISPTIVTTTVTTSSGDLTLNSAGGALQWDGSGNIVMNSQWINNLSDPAQAQDAATKQYVDDAVSTGITIHEPVRLETPVAIGGTYAQGGTTATVTDTVAGNTVVFSSAISPQVNDQYWFSNSFNGIVANTPYFVVSAPNTSAAVLSTTWSGSPVSNITGGTGLTQSVRINSGQGATLTNNGANVTLVIDGVTVANTNRILVYNQANAVQNGVYVVSEAGNATTAWQLTRSSDMDTYIPNDIDGLDVGDYFYVQEGDTGAGESYVMTAPVGPTIIGFANLTFTQFSASQVYTANTAAGLVLNGTVFSAKVDNNTTAFDGGGNISIKVGANLTTPNIGNATGNSLTLTGNGNISATNVSLTGLISATGNITGGNLLTSGAVDASTVSATGNVSGGNVTTVGQVVATGNVSGGNVTTAGQVVATGNVSGGNLTTAGQVVATGNVAGGNITTGGIVNATGNLVTGANIVATGYANITGNINGSGAVFSGNVSAANFIGNISGNIDAGGANTNIQFNDGDILAGSAAFTFDKSSNAVVASGNISGGNITTAGVVSATGNVSGGNVTTAGEVTATGNVAGGNLTTAGQVAATGNVSGGNVIATALVTGANVSATSNVSGANVIGTTSGKFGNIVISGDDITDTNGRVNFNTAGADVDFAVNGDTVANVFYVDAGTGTASFGSSTQTTNALVAFNASTSILMPVGNTVQRPSTGVTGMMRFNSTTNSVEVYDNSAWTAVGVPVFTLIDDQQFNGDGSTVAFTINSNQTTNSCIVSINGVVQIPTIAYSVSVTTLTFTEAPESGDLIDVRQLTTTTSVVSISNTSGNAIVQVSDTTNDVSITGDLIPTSNVTFDLGSSTMRWRDGYFAGNSITLGNTVIKNTSGNTIGFFGPNGTTPATIDASSIDTTQIANGTSSLSVVSSGGNIRANVGGSTVQTISSGGANITGTLGVTGNITGSFILGNGSQLTGIDATSIQNGTSNVRVTSSGGNVTTSVGGTANVVVITTTGANIAGTLNATGNITGGNLLTSGNIVDTGALSIITGSSGNVNIAPNGTNTLVATTTGANITGTLNATGNANVANIGATNAVFSGMTINGNAIITGNLRVDGTETIFNVQTLSVNDKDIIVANNVTGGANVDGSGLQAGNPGVATWFFNNATTSWQSNIGITPTANGTLSLGGASNYWGNAFLTTATVTGNITLGGSLIDTAALEIITGSNGNITLSPNGTGVIVVNKDIINGRANGVGNIGSTSNRFNQVFALASSAQYADLAEKYTADAEYAPGTVVVFGGSAEVTADGTDSDHRVAGVVSTNPAFIMNDTLDSVYVAAVALTGRVPCRVTGTVRKGDLMVAAGNGVARAESDPRVGTVIGKALENHEGTEGVIEVVVGRF